MNQKPDVQPNAKKRRTRSKPSNVAVRQLVRMPLGELHRAALELVEMDRQTAAFFAERLTGAMYDADQRKARTPVEG